MEPVRSLAALAACAVGCYSPAAPVGAPCPDDVCPTGQACVAGTCQRDGTSGGSGQPPTEALSGLRWQLRCMGPHPDPAETQLCVTNHPLDDVVLVGGSLSDRFQVTVRIRGVAELSPFQGGAASSTPWYVGGDVTDDYHNDYYLTVTAPFQTYHLNASTVASDTVRALDYVATFPIDGGALVFFGSDPQDLGDPNPSQLINKDGTGKELTVPGVDTSPSPYNGQFLRIDVVDTKPR